MSKRKRNFPKGTSTDRSPSLLRPREGFSTSWAPSVHKNYPKSWRRVKAPPNAGHPETRPPARERKRPKIHAPKPKWNPAEIHCGICGVNAVSERGYRQILAHFQRVHGASLIVLYSVKGLAVAFPKESAEGK